MKEGRIIKALSGFYYVKSNHTIYACKGRGVFRNQKITPLVGDLVTFEQTNDGEGYIKEIDARKNELQRPPIANIDQAVVVSSVCQPSFSALLLDRFLVIVEAKKIKPMIVITKKDLASIEEVEEMTSYKQAYEKIGYKVEFLSLQSSQGMEKIKQFFQDKITVLMGQSGVGKSTLLNALNPELSIKTGEISHSLGRGKHTTRHVEFLQINNGLVADTPGFSSLDFPEMEAEDLSAYFVEMNKRRDACKFRRCLHDQEPQCAVKKAVENGEINNYRYEHYLQFLQEIISRKPRY